MDAFVPSGGNGTSQLLSIDVVTLVRALTKKAPAPTNSINFCCAMKKPTT